MSDKHEFNSEISPDNSIVVPEHLQDKFPPASKVKVGISHNNQEQAEPEYLYRYRPFDKYSKDILTNNQLWFASPSSFNDPFDCKAMFDKTNITEDDWKGYFELLYQNTTTPLDINLQQFVERGLLSVHNDKEKAENWIQKISEIGESFSRLKILCLSERRNNILMWSHYADNHKGFCLALNKNIIEEWSDKIILLPIDYRDKFPSFRETYEKLNYMIAKGIQKGDENTYPFNAYFKSPHWKYEQEWRLLKIPYQGDEGEIKVDGLSIPFSPEMLTGIIFGCEMNEKNKDAIRYLVQLNPKMEHVKYHQAKKKDSEFGLEIRKTEWKPDEGWVLLPE